MDDIVREMLDLEAVMEMHQQTLNDMYLRIARDEQIVSVSYFCVTPVGC